MGTNRKIIFVNDEIYHVYNRGVEKRPIFTNKKELQRALNALRFYRFSNLPFRLSKFLNLTSDERIKVLQKIETEHEKLVEIICFCLMPNHFHLLLKQKKEGGIPIFVANFTNSYAKYFNTKNKRIGPLFQGRFKAVHISNDEQLIHVSRYIHLNPVVASFIKTEDLISHTWSSYSEYLGLSNLQITDNEIVMSFFKNKDKYKQFVLDQVDYGKNLEQIKHLTLEDEV